MLQQHVYIFFNSPEVGTPECAEGPTLVGGQIVGVDGDDGVLGPVRLEGVRNRLVGPVGILPRDHQHYRQEQRQNQGVRRGHLQKVVLSLKTDNCLEKFQLFSG